MHTHTQEEGFRQHLSITKKIRILEDLSGSTCCHLGHEVKYKLCFTEQPKVQHFGKFL